MENIKYIKHGLLIAAVTGLIACGGGSNSSSDVNYSGKTNQAKITADNVDGFYDATNGAESPPNTSANAATNSSQQSTQGNRLSRFASRLRSASSSASSGYSGGSSGTNAQIVSADDVIDGPCGGQAVVAGTKDDEVFNVDLTVSFQDYCDDDGTFNGVIGVVGSDNDTTGVFNIKMTFTDITYKSDTDSMALNGEVSAAGTESDFTIKMTLNYKDSNANKVYRVENYVLTVTDSNTLTLQAKVYHPDYGYVVVSTPTPVYVDPVTDLPVSGVVVLTGDNSSATIVFHDGYYMITVVDGTTTTEKQCDSTTDVCTVISP